VNFDELTPATAEERYDSDPIPPLPPVPTVIYHTRVPWARLVVVMVAVAVAVNVVMRVGLR
jgi:hypothetical protein